MSAPPSIFDTCKPRPEVLQGELPDSIFAAELWDVFTRSPNTHADYREPARFFAGTHPTENMKLLVKEVAERLAGVEGGTPVFRLETGFGGGKTHSLISLVHVAREGSRAAGLLGDYGIKRFPAPDETRVAAFVGDFADPLMGIELEAGGHKQRAFTPWGQLAFLAGGPAGYAAVKENDLVGIAPARPALEAALGDGPVLLLLDELVLYMARAAALPEAAPRSKVNSQWPTFLQTLFGLAAARPRTALVLTLPSEQDANRKVVGDLKQHLHAVMETVAELGSTTARQARNLTPTQSFERAAVLGRRLFDSVDRTHAPAVADAYRKYLDQQRAAGAKIDGRGAEAGYAALIEKSYPFHPELVRLFSERLAEIQDFQQTRGALRLVARTIRAAWEGRARLGKPLLLQAQHLDLARGEIRDEILNRLKRQAFERGLDADVAKAEGGTHATEAETGWPWKAATEAASVAFLHSLPDGSKGVTGPEVALALGRPGVDLHYVAKGLEETERRAWYMRREAEDKFLFRTRASINKRFQERQSQVQPGEVRELLDTWIKEVYSGFSAFQMIHFPAAPGDIANRADKVRLAVIHYDKEAGYVGPGAGDKLDFVKQLFTKAGSEEGPRVHRNNLIFLLAEGSRVAGLKDAVRSLLAWERVQKDIEAEQTTLAQGSGSGFPEMRRRARDGASGVPAEFVALEDDLGKVREQQGPQEINVRTRLLEAYRVLAFPRGGGSGVADLFSGAASGPLLECYRVDFGETPEGAGKGRRATRAGVAEAPILQCLRNNNKLTPEPAPGNPVVLAPALVKQPPLWLAGETSLSTEEAWERIRKEPELPMLLRQADLLPTLKAGLTAQPDALWVYYARAEKKVFTRENASELAPAISSAHLLYDTKAAVADRILPVKEVRAQEVWDHLWPRSGATPADTVAAPKLLDAAKAGAHFPVLPDRAVLWRAMQEGARDNRWVLYLRGPNIAIGAQEIGEWPGTARFDDNTELWAYDAALAQGIYPRTKGGTGPATPEPPTAARIKERCWPAGAAEAPSEDIERRARTIWADLARPRLESLLRDGVREGLWCAWRKDDDEAFHTPQDTPLPSVAVSPAWALVDPASPLALELDGLRPGKGPQPVSRTGTPREAITGIWDTLAGQRGLEVQELTLTATDRETFDNTLLATWADRPRAAEAHATLRASGQRVAGGKTETVHLEFEGRFEEIKGMLAPVWPFRTQGDLDVAITLRFRFPSPTPADDAALATYRTALVNASHGRIEATLVPVRARRPGAAAGGA